MRLYTVKPKSDRNALMSHDFRIEDDHGHPMKWVKGFSLKVEGGKPVSITIERYITSADEIDLDLLQTEYSETEAPSVP